MTNSERIAHETQEIVRVIDDATSCITNRDVDAYPRAWVRAPYVRRSDGWSNGGAGGGLRLQEGWDDIWGFVRQLLTGPWVIYPNGTLRKNWHVRVSGDTAWATYEQYALDAGGMPAPELLGFTHETRMLEKHDGEWKFTYLGFFLQMPQQMDQALVTVDENAAIIAMNRAATECIGNSQTLKVRNGRLHAAGRDADNRLLAAVKALARDNPWTTGALRHPFVLKAPDGTCECVCWMTTSPLALGQVTLAISDSGASRRRLQNAALLYRLSPAQTRLAEMIVTGHDLVTAAEQLGVTVNTARTQLQRMFAKTGVRSQTALVTSLLSVSGPA